MLTDPPYGTYPAFLGRGARLEEAPVPGPKALSPRGNLVLFASGRAVFRILQALEELSYSWYELVWPKRAPRGSTMPGGDPSGPTSGWSWPREPGAERLQAPALGRPGAQGATVRRRSNGAHWGKAEALPYEDDGTRLPLSVLPAFALSPEERTGHPTQKPLALARYLVETLPPSPGGLVVDPYAGSGNLRGGGPGAGEALRRGRS